MFTLSLLFTQVSHLALGFLCHTAAHKGNYYYFSFSLTILALYLIVAEKKSFNAFYLEWPRYLKKNSPSLCTQTKTVERWVKTFLVVKGRNLQLSNKSLRLDPRCHWLPLTTWRTLYEHELYAVVYSLVLPLYQQQTKLGRRKSPLFPLLFSNSSISACAPSRRR